MYDAMIQEIVQINFIPGCIIVFMIVFFVFNSPYEHELTKLFYPVLILLVGLMIADNADYFVFAVGDTGMMHVFTGFMGYNLRIFILVLSLRIAFRKSVRRYVRIGLFIPAFINLAITSLAFFTPYVFSYAEDGHIIRGPFAFTPHVILLMYAILMYVYSIHIWIRHDRRCEAAVIFMIVTLALLGTFCELMFKLRGILIGVISMAVIFYYLCIHIENFKYDILTNVLNRTSFYADLKKLNGLLHTAHAGIMSIDLNDLKKINDSGGHDKGDEAIKTTASIINAQLDAGCTLYRVGGDEFEVICRDRTEEDILNMIDRIRAEMRKSEYTFAIGYSMWNRKEPISDVIKRADERMYADKRELKA